MDTKININNYELYAIDFIDGNLNEELRLSFEQFLSENPEISDEIEEMKSFSLQPDEIVFENKNSLKKSPIEGLSYSEYLIIADIENEINRNEKNDLEKQFETNENIIADYNLFLKTKLPEETIFYPNKEKLKKSNVVQIRRIAYAISTIAAMFILFLGGSYLLNNKTENTLVPNSVVFDCNRLIDTVIVDEVFNNEEIIEEVQNVVAQNEIYYQADDTLMQINQSINEDFLDDNSSQLAFDEVYKDLPVKKDIYRLSIIENNQLDFVIVDDYHNEETQIAISDISKKLTPEKVANFIFAKFQTVTESDNTIRLAYDNNKDCYGLEVNDKIYTVCLK